MASFDGSNKSSVGGAQHIAYHIPTSPRLEAIKKRVMEKASPEAIAYLDPLNYPGPRILKDASTMTEMEWQDARKNSIGSSAIAQVFGESPYPDCTNLDLYYSKIGVKPQIPDSVEDAQRRERMFLYGHLMEDYIRLCVEQFWPGCKVLVDTNIYAAQEGDFLTANLDGMMQLPDGTWVHLEFKTTSEFGEDAYANGTIPPHYRRQLIQCQHIMGVWESRIVVAFSRDNVKSYTYIRDLDDEMEQVQAGIDFWKNHVIPQIPPEPKGPPANLVATVKKYGGYGDVKAPEEVLDDTLTEDVARYFEIAEEIKALDAQKKRLTAEKEKAMVPIAQAMGRTTKAYVTDGNEAFSISWKPRAGKRICDFDRLKEDYPDIYDAYVSQPAEGSRPMSIKMADVR